ncbi:MAG TPA: hypothetical protein VGP93_06560 [Polyangiaceae bacterium]|nr:hypothetical protein [Polyangiaceae bacterium]
MTSLPPLLSASAVHKPRSMPQEQGNKVFPEVPPSEQNPGNSTPPGAGAGRKSSAADDLADGLDLMLRAARKAVRSLDPRIEEAGRRALERLEQFDASTLSEVGRRVASKVDPKKLEQVAEEAGREIATLVERVAGRIESALGRRSDAPKSHGATDSGPEAAPESHPPARKVRVEGG